MIKEIRNIVSNFVWQHALAGRCKTLRILTYHGVIEKYEDKFLERNFVTCEEFNAQLDFFQKNFRFTSIPEVLEKNKDFSNEVVITFDDGYENNLVAANILTKRKIPFTIFLTTDLLGAKGKSIWPVDLALFILKGSLTEICLFDKIWRLDNDEQKKKVYKRIKQIFKELKSAEKDKLMQELGNLYPADELAKLHGKFKSFNMLTVGQAANLSVNPLCNLGCHGYRHELLHSNQDESVVVSEINRSKEQFKLYFGSEPQYFGYPNGDSSIVAENHLKNAGFKAAFTNTPSPWVIIKNNFEIPRLNISGSFDTFKQKVNHY